MGDGHWAVLVEYEVVNGGEFEVNRERTDRFYREADATCTNKYLTLILAVIVP